MDRLHSNQILLTAIYLNIQVKGDNVEMQTIKRHPICVCVDQRKSQNTHWNNTFNYSSKLFCLCLKIFSLAFEEFHFLYIWVGAWRQMNFHPF